MIITFIFKEGGTHICSVGIFNAQEVTKLLDNYMYDTNINNPVFAFKPRAVRLR